MSAGGSLGQAFQIKGITDYWLSLAELPPHKQAPGRWSCSCI
jgi:hypothetical protein